MPPVPKLPTRESTSPPSFQPKTYSGSSLFKAPQKVFGQKPSFSTTSSASGNQGLFGGKKPFDASASSFESVASATEAIDSKFKSQQTNVFATKNIEKTSQNLFTKPTSAINEPKVVTPDLFAGTSHKVSTSSLFGGTNNPELTDDTSVNIFAPPKPAGSSLFSTKSDTKLFGSGKTSTKGLFGASDIVDVSDETYSQPRTSSLFTKPDAPIAEKASNIFKISDNNKQSNFQEPVTVFGNKPSSKISIKERLGIKPTPLREPNEPLSSGSNNPTSGSATPSECGSESSESLLDISPGSTKTFKRLTSKEELMSIKSIICEQVPSLALNENIMGKHFSQFGKVEKMVINPEKQSATIHFTDHKSARKAKDKGLLISNKISPIGAIYYHKKSRKSSEHKRESVKDIFQAKSSSNDDYDDVQDELKSIEEYSIGMFQPSTYSMPSEKVDILGGARKRKGDTAQAPGLKKSTLNPTLPEIVPSIPTASTTTARPAFNKADLLIKMQAQAMDDLDRFNILEARDKYIKEISTNQNSIHSSLKGSCPDICPEKERYSRSAKNQLRIYEKKDGILHTKAAVKEYSRSAADASIPLSHDLRPAHILKLTMDHLLCNVIDRIDYIPNCCSMEDWYDKVEDEGGSTNTNLMPSSSVGESTGDWFEFLWSATRGIRKDITMQVMTDLLAADLVEKCARFHIMCAERLVEEDNHNFDKKLNDENLTKCIQTLKHMYYDLSLEGTRCPNEPEFRAYEVLLNMNDGDTLRRVQNLEPWIRESSEITFACKVVTSISTNNYVRFFKLVRSATLLQGCILLRYFNQVRRKALETMIRAYCFSRSVTLYSLSKVMAILGFEDISSCARYCRLHGLENEIESDTLYMDRSTFSYPVETPSMQRPINLVESKRNVKWSAVINGGPLPSYNPYISYEPHNSFDDEGYLKRESYEAEDQTASGDGNQSFQELKERQAKILGQEQAAHEIKEDIINEVSLSLIQSVSSSTIKELHMINASKGIIEDIEKEVTEEMCSKFAAEAIKEEKNLELQRRIRKEEIMNTADDLSEEITEEVLKELMKQILEEEMQLYEQNLKIQKQINLAPDIWEDIRDEVVDNELKMIANVAMKEALLKRENMVEKMRENSLIALQRKSFMAWRHYVAKLQKQKNTLANFPSTPSFKSIAEQADLLAWGNQNDEKPHSPKSIRDKLKNKLVLSNLLNAVDLEEEFLNNLVLKKVDLFQNVGKYLVKKNPQDNSLAWKLVICMPNTNFESRNRAVCEMIKRKFSGDSDSSYDDSNLLLCQTKLYEDQDPPQFSIQPKRSIAICVRSVNSQVLEEEICQSEKKRRDNLLGTSSILFLHIENDETEYDDQSIVDDEDDSLERLETLLNNMPKNPPVPLHILTTSRNDFTEIVKALKLDNWVQQNIVKCYHVTRISINIFNLESLVNIDNSVIWLAEKSPSNPMNFSEKTNNGAQRKLVIKPLSHLVQDVIFNKVISEYYENLEARRVKGCTHQHPNILINLFNSAIEHIIERINNENLKEISWPIPEFKRSSLVYGSGEVIPSYWNEVAYIEKVIETLKGALLPNISEQAVKISSRIEQKKLIESYIAQLLRKHYDATILKSEVKELLTDQRNESLFPWTDLIAAIVKYRINCMNVIDPFCAKDTEMIIGVYHEDFLVPSTWTSNLYSDGIKSTKCERLDKSQSNSYSNALQYLRKRSLDDLDKKLIDEKWKSEEFEKILKSAIDGNTEMNVVYQDFKKRKSCSKHEPSSVIATDEDSPQPTSKKYYYVPISYIRPAISHLSGKSPTGPTQKVELLGNYDRHDISPVAPMNAFSSFRSEETSCYGTKTPTSLSYSHSKSGIVQSLKTNVEKDIEESEAFDKKLQEALLTD